MMARVDEHGARHRHANPMDAETRKKKKKKGFRVQFENITQPKQKLRSDVRYSCSSSTFPLAKTSLQTTHQVQSPDGYTFVPAGKYPDLTETCKEFSRKKGAKVYVVSVRICFSNLVSDTKLVERLRLRPDVPNKYPIIFTALDTTSRTSCSTQLAAI